MPPEHFDLRIELTPEGAVRHIHLDFPRKRRRLALRLLEGAMPGIRALDEEASAPSTPPEPSSEP